MTHLLQATQREYQKIGRMVIGSDFEPQPANGHGQRPERAGAMPMPAPNRRHADDAEELARQARQPEAEADAADGLREDQAALLGLNQAVGNRSVARLMRSGGSPLPGPVRRQSEARLGQPVSDDVRLHTDPTRPIAPRRSARPPTPSGPTSSLARTPTTPAPKPATRCWRMSWLTPCSKSRPARPLTPPASTHATTPANSRPRPPAAASPPC